MFSSRNLNEASLFKSVATKVCDVKTEVEDITEYFLCPNRPGTLHDFRSHEIADQLTLLDAELFYKIEV